jgi:hypothetical protein
VVKRNEFDQSGAGMLRAANRGALDSMLVVGKPPWHYTYNADMIRLHDAGTKITSREINEAAGLGWNVYQTPAYIRVGGEPALDENGFLAKDSQASIEVGFKLVGTQREPG